MLGEEEYILNLMNSASKVQQNLPSRISGLYIFLQTGGLIHPLPPQMPSYADL